MIYARWTGAAWQTQTVDSTKAVSPGPIVLDSNGNPHITYSGTTYSTYADLVYLMYATTSEPTQAPISTVESALLIAIPAVAILTTAIYIWKKKNESAKAGHRFPLS